MPNDVIIKSQGGKGSATVTSRRLDVNSLILSSLVPHAYDYIEFTYVAAGNGEGKIETATYNTEGSGGTTVAILTLTYNSDHKLATVTKS
jgi:hypothetical protein